MKTITEPGRTAVPGRPPDVASLYAAHRLALVRLAVLLVDDLPTAEDVVQDAFAELARHPDRLRDPGAAFGYLRTSVVNRSRSALRRRRTARSYVAPATGNAPPADEPVVLAEEHATLLAAVRRLAPRQREVLVALLVRPVRGRDRRDLRDLPRVGQVHRQPRAHRAGADPHRERGVPMIDLDQRLSDAFQARADSVGPEHLTPAMAPASTPARRRGPVLAGLAAAAAAITVATVLVTGTDGPRAGDSGAAGTTGASEEAGPTAAVPDRAELVPLASGRSVSHEAGTEVWLDGTVLRLEKDDSVWSTDLGNLGRVALTDLSVDFEGRLGYVFRQEVDGVERPLVMVFEGGERFVLLEWSSRDVAPELGPGDWTTWVGVDGRLYSSRDGDAAAFRWALGDPAGPLPDPVRVATAVGQPLEQRP